MEPPEAGLDVGARIVVHVADERLVRVDPEELLVVAADHREHADLWSARARARARIERHRDTEGGQGGPA